MKDFLWKYWVNWGTEAAHDFQKTLCATATEFEWDRFELIFSNEE